VVANMLAQQPPKKRLDPRVNARRVSEVIEEGRQRTGSRIVRFGKRLMKAVYVVSLLGVFVAGCAGLFLVIRELGPLTKEWFVVRQVTVEGLNHVTRREVMARLGLKPDTTLYALNPNWLAERLTQHPWIKEAAVTLVPFHEIRVSITERSPAAVVRATTENLLVDDEGYILASLGTKDDPSLPILSGLDTRGLRQGRLEARHAAKVGAELARLIAGTVGGRADINVTHLSNLVVLVQGIRFQFSAASMDRQWQRFLQMRPAFRDVAFGQEERGQEFDLRYRDRVIIRGKGVS
jgi:cell division protein FtsQ